jgi:hypothetical protein
MEKKVLNELHVGLLGKIFFAACGAWLVGKATNLKFRGTPSDIQAVTNAMLASKKFQEELRKPGATVQSVMDKLNLKHASAREFEAKLGIPWPL